MRYAFLAFAFLLTFAAGASADKVVTYFTVTLADVRHVCFARSSVPNGWTVRVEALARASNGPGTPVSISGPVTVGQKTAVENYIAAHVLGPLNTQEGL